MTRRLQLALLLFVLPQFVIASPQADKDTFRNYYLELFPDVEPNDFVYGVYAIDPKLREQSEEVESFPPYEFALDEGRSLAQERSEDGRTIEDCLGNEPVHRHPYFDEERQQVVTLGNAVNRCRESLGLAKLSYQKQPLANLLAHLTFLEREKPRVTPPPESAKSLAAYERGKAYFYTKRGQLNLSCADCHITSAGKHLREQTLAPLLGVVNHYPVYGLRSGAIGSLHQRFVGCIEQVRGEAEHLQSRIFTELEYFLSIMADGLPIVGPTTQR